MRTTKPRTRKTINQNPVNSTINQTVNSKFGVLPDDSHQDAFEPDAGDVALAKKILRQQMVSKNAPAAAKVQAARTLLELVGALGRNSKPATEKGKPLAEMTRAELEAELAATGD